MTMLILDGFEGYAETGDNSSGGMANGAQWEGNTVATQPRYVDHSGRGLAKRWGGFNSGMAKTMHTEIFNAATVTVGMAMSTESVLAADMLAVLGVQVDRTDLAVADDLFCFIASNGSTWELKYGAGVGTIDTGVSVQVSTWTYFELQVELTSASTANVRVRIDGVMTAVNQEIPFGGALCHRASISLTAPTSNSSAFMDDFYLADDLSFYGPLAIARVPLTQATHAALSPVGAGTAQECIDEEVCDEDATYVVSSVPGSKQTFAGTFAEPPMFILLSSQTRSEALSATGQRFVDGPNGAYREHATGYYPETYASKPQILSTLYDGSPLTQVGANSQEFGFEIVNE